MNTRNTLLDRLIHTYFLNIICNRLHEYIKNKYNIYVDYFQHITSLTYFYEPCYMNSSLNYSANDCKLYNDIMVTLE